MKKITAIMLILTLCVCLFASCKAANGEKEVNIKQQFDKTGIQLIVPKSAENVKYFTDTKNGQSSPKATFEFNGFKFTYTAEKTDKKERFDNSGLGYKYTESTDWGIYDREGEIHAGEQGGYVCWLDVGYIFTVFADGVNVEDLANVADCIFEAEIAVGEEEADGNIPPEEGDEQWEELTGWELGVNLWKYEDEDRYLLISANRTYTECGADRTPDEKIHFWKNDESDNSKIILLDDEGNTKDTLTVTGDSEYCMLTDGAGKQLSMSNDIMNGEYTFYASPDYYSDEELLVIAYVDFWLSDDEVKNIKEGDTLHYLYYDAYDMVVEDVEKTEEGRIIVNGETEIEYKTAAGAWKVLNPDSIPMESKGSCFVFPEAVFADNVHNGEHKTFKDCITSSEEGFYGTIVVDKGEATVITAEE